MRILHLNEHLDWKGGVEVYLLSLLPELERRGHEVIVGYVHGRPELATCAESLPQLEKADAASRQAGYAASRALIDCHRPDVVHVHQTHNQGVIEACLESVPTLIHGHDYRYLCPASSFFYRRSQSVCRLPAGPHCFAVTIARHCLTPRPQYAFAYYGRVRWARRQRHRFAHVVAPSESCRQRFLQAGFDGGKVTTLPYFCPIPALDEPRPMPDRPTLLFIGRIAPNKGARYFVEALGALPERVRGVMVGNFDEGSRREMLEVARSTGCAQRLELRPWAGREEVAAAFREASVFVFPSIWPETLGIVGLEALATGVPAVASDIGGVREWLRDGENGYLVPPKDGAAIAARAAPLLEDAAQNRAFGLRGQSLIRERFSTDWHVGRLLALYQGIV
jgi:glycosyltransferase involved in cell wall biosynthesis